MPPPFALGEVFEIDGIVLPVDVVTGAKGIVLPVVVVLGGRGIVATDVVLELVDSLELLLSPDVTGAAIRGDAVVAAAS